MHVQVLPGLDSSNYSHIYLKVKKVNRNVTSRSRVLFAKALSIQSAPGGRLDNKATLLRTTTYTEKFSLLSRSYLSLTHSLPLSCSCAKVLHKSVFVNENAAL